MLRSFLPIGQGGFAVELFDDARYNVVFDCGTSTANGNSSGKQAIEEQIRQTFDQGTTIQKVFISHLHDDHINGLPYLLRYCRVSRVYLPYLTPSEQVITLMLLQAALNDENGPLLQHLITGRPLYRDEVDTRVVYVLPSEQEDFRQKDFYGELDLSGRTISLDDYKNSDTDHWWFIPFVYRNAQRSQQFEAILNNWGIGASIQSQILTDSFWNDRTLLKKLKKVYEQIVSNLNLTTMVVWSGPESGHKQYPRKDNNCIYMPKMCCRRYYEPGCLYTGDYRASNLDEWNALRAAYDNVWNRTGVFTIPHHGSSYNFNPDMVKQYAAYIINAGYQNHYGHPHQKVLRHLIDNGCQFYWVNEHSGSEISFRIPF